MTEADELIARLYGRAMYLRNRGEVKSPDLMESAAKALHAASPSRSEGVSQHAVQTITPIDHPHRPPTAFVERDYLRKQIADFGPEVVAATLRTYALAAPPEGSYAGSLWAIYEWLTARGAAQASLWSCTGCGSQASLEQIKSEGFLSCCPERKMVSPVPSATCGCLACVTDDQPNIEGLKR